MIIAAEQIQLNGILERAADLLDMPAELRARAEEDYQDLCEWLKRDNESRDRIDSEVYVQGSLRTGTIIRPLGDDAEYDVDVVYRRIQSKESLSKEELKAHVGEQLARYVKDRERRRLEVPELEPKSRCWTLQYEGFHLDVLPALPDDEASAHNNRRIEDAILIVDRDLRNWQHSNPKGYADWFFEQTTSLLTEQREKMAAEASVDVETIPEGRARTPLQRAVQILKRHRDFTYEGDAENCPTSIIISTLAAKAYGNEENLYDALVAIASKMPEHIQRRDGKYYVLNPINQNENFADRWNEPGSKRAEKFHEWLTDIRQTFEAALEHRGMDKVAASLAPRLGQSIVEQVLRDAGLGLRASREASRLTATPGTATLGVAGGIAVKPHTFFGNVED